MDKPAFADEPPAMGWWQRKIAGFVCAAIALAIFALILYLLQSFKSQSLRFQAETYTTHTAAQRQR